VPCSSTKGWTGHTLGASGAIEAVIASICLEDGLVPGCLNVDRADPEFRADVAVSNRAARLRHVISNSFGFGGSNCALVFGQG
jgi:3-oxoacyl-[acyl-carrier-protein] synthase-1